MPNIVEVTIEEPDVEPEVSFDRDELGAIEIPEPVDEPDIEVAEQVPFDIVEEMPKPAGGYASFYTYINKHLKYPNQARRMNIEGKVYVKFVVLENGNFDQIHIVRGIGAGCDEEVLRVMEKAPKWNPGKQRGRPVKVWQMVPINFQLN